jgi:hypothetical protein
MNVSSESAVAETVTERPAFSFAMARVVEVAAFSVAELFLALTAPLSASRLSWPLTT